MNRCLEIAGNGLGTTRPNPMVGCVITHNNIIVGEGFTSQYGGDHAEVNAINSIRDFSLVKEATLYVTLEPCSHHGKTPPCTDLIIDKGFKTVVIGCEDPNPKVSGNGIKKLKQAGCEVLVGVLSKECKNHHKRFFTYQKKKRPYVILKWAQSKNGFIAPDEQPESKPVWISSKTSRQLVHKWRAEEQAILIGTHTVNKDDPSLTVRDWTGSNPLRIVIDRFNTLKKSFKVFNDDAHTLVLSEQNVDFSNSVSQQICDLLYDMKINSLLIEGGAATHQAFIDEDLWDEARVFTSAMEIESGITAAHINQPSVTGSQISTDELKIYVND